VAELDDQHLAEDLTELGQVTTASLPSAGSTADAERDRAARLAIGAGGAVLAATAGIAAGDALLRERAQTAAANDPRNEHPVLSDPATQPTPAATTPASPSSQVAGTERIESTGALPQGPSQVQTTSAPTEPVVAAASEPAAPTIVETHPAVPSPVTADTPARSLADAAGATVAADAPGFTSPDSIPGYQPASAPLGTAPEITLASTPKPTGEAPAARPDTGPGVLPSTVTDTDNTQQPNVQGFIAGGPDATAAGVGTGGGGVTTEDELWGAAEAAAPAIAATQPDMTPDAGTAATATQPIIAPADDSEPEWVAALRERDAQEAAIKATAETPATPAVAAVAETEPATETPAPVLASDPVPATEDPAPAAVLSDAAPIGDTTSATTADPTTFTPLEDSATPTPTGETPIAIADPVIADPPAEVPDAAMPTVPSAPREDLNDLPESVRARLEENPGLLHGLDDARMAYHRQVADVIRQIDPAAADDYLDSRGVVPTTEPTPNPDVPEPFSEPDTVEMDAIRHPDAAFRTPADDAAIAAPDAIPTPPTGDDHDLTPPPSDALHPSDTVGHPAVEHPGDVGDDLTPPATLSTTPVDPAVMAGPTGIVGDDSHFEGAVTGEGNHGVWTDIPAHIETEPVEEPHIEEPVVEPESVHEDPISHPEPEPYHDPTPEPIHDPVSELPVDPMPEPEPGHEEDPTNSALDI
jgi:hypothetical protein